MLGQLQCTRLLLHLIGTATVTQLLMSLRCAVHMQMQQEQQGSSADSDGGHNQRQGQESVSQYGRCF